MPDRHKLARPAVTQPGGPPGVVQSMLESVAGILPGDVIQFSDVTLHDPTTGSTFSYAHHTAIVTGISGDTIGVLQQNVFTYPDEPNSIIQTVQVGSMNLNDLQGGSVMWVY
jgi:hypothetical protein